MGLLRFFKKSKLAHKKAVLDHVFFGAGKFRWTEIEAFTNHFSTVVGSGGFSKVYLARMTAGAAAVKILGGSERLNRMFRQELDILLQLRHRNIVGFIGYCDEGGEKLSNYFLKMFLFSWVELGLLSEFDSFN